MVPLLATATPVGEAKEPPTPSAKADFPLPAIVVTKPLGVTLRMQWFDVSATMTLPLASKATPRGA
jgi:hypothetical protein